MSDQNIQQVGRVSPTDQPNRTVQLQQVAAQLQTEVRQRTQAAQGAGASGPGASNAQNAALTAKGAEEQQKAQQQQAKQAADEGKTTSSTSLRFQVDDKTNEVTVMIVDRASGKVISTIPSEAIKDLPAGELLQYSA